MTHDPRPWFLYRVLSEREAATEKILMRHKFVSYHPTETRALFRRRARSKVRVERIYPLIPGYLWVRTNHEIDWPQVLRLTPAIIGIVGCAGRPAVFHQAHIESLMQLSSAKIERYVSDGKSFRCNDPVRVVSGPAYGQVGKVVSVKGHRARVVLDMLGVPREVEIKAEALEAA